MDAPNAGRKLITRCDRYCSRHTLSIRTFKPRIRHFPSGRKYRSRNAGQLAHICDGKISPDEQVNVLYAARSEIVDVESQVTVHVLPHDTRKMCTRWVL